jgi:hypothetical protein
MDDQKHEIEQKEITCEAEKKTPPQLFIPQVPDLSGVVIEPTNSLDPHDRWFHKF